MSKGSFSSDYLWFVAGCRPPSDWDATFDADSSDSLGWLELDPFLKESGRLPANLGNAPLASWVLARLARLTDGLLGIYQGKEQHNDGGGYFLEFEVIRRQDSPYQGYLFEVDSKDVFRTAAWLQLEGSMYGVVLLCDCMPEMNPERVEQAFLHALIAKPKDVAVYDLEVYDPEWGTSIKDCPNCYGWNGECYLGEGNIRD